MNARLSSETVHASTVALEGRAVLISGPSGSGKSDLALRLLDRGFSLVSDDQTLVRRERDRLVASPPPNIAGKLEIRGIGIVDMDNLTDVPVAPIPATTTSTMRAAIRPYSIAVAPRSSLASRTGRVSQALNFGTLRNIRYSLLES